MHKQKSCFQTENNGINIYDFDAFIWRHKYTNHIPGSSQILSYKQIHFKYQIIEWKINKIQDYDRKIISMT